MSGYCGGLLITVLIIVNVGRIQGRQFLSHKRTNSFRQTLHNFKNVQYYADLNIGGQKIAGIFDTGSFELLVRSTRCGECAHPTPAYDHAKSTTYTKNGTVTKHVFGSGPCVSMMGYESVTVGEFNSPVQAFWEIIDHRIDVLDKAKFAAIVGIGPQFGFGNIEKTLLMSYGIDEFSVCLQKPSGSSGYLTWGPAEPQLPDSKLAIAKVIGSHHWVARMHNATFSGPPRSHLAQVPCGGSGCAVMFDSGTSLIAAPGLALMQLSEQIDPIKPDCSNVHELPTLQFVIDGTLFELPPQAYVMRITKSVLESDSIWDILFFKPKIRKLDQCMPAFMQIDIMSQFGPVWILGMPFFRYYHTTFDRSNQVMKFAIAGPECEPEPFASVKESSNASALAAKPKSLLGFGSDIAEQPLEVEVGAMIPPTLSEQMDYPFDNKGMLDL